VRFFDNAKALARGVGGPLSLLDTRGEALTLLPDASDPSCLYYAFLHHLVSKHAPIDVIEIGTYRGTSAAHFAHGNLGCMDLHEGTHVRGHVTTIDINPDAERCVRDLHLDLTNVTALTGDSFVVFDRVAPNWRSHNVKVDVLFIDGEHTFARAYAEYWLYREFVREGGLILFDDAGLPMDGDEMNVLWDFIDEPKLRVDHLHAGCGFGIVERRDRDVLSVHQVINRANAEIRARRKR
jgi:predicted O-methyltransferase YrrM